MIIEMRLLDDDHNCIAQIMGPGETESDISAFAEVFKVASRLALKREGQEEDYLAMLPAGTEITMVGENIRPPVDLGEPVQLEEDLHYDEHIAALDGRREPEAKAGGYDNYRIYAERQLIGEAEQKSEIANPEGEGWIEWNGGSLRPVDA